MFVRIKLSRQIGQIGSASSYASRIKVFFISKFNVSCLGHEAIDDSVKGNAIIFALAGKFLDSFNMLRGIIGEKLYDHFSIL